MDNIFNFFKHNGQNDFFKNRQPKKGGSIKALIIVLIGFIIFEYFALVPLNFRSPEFLMVLAFFILIYTGLRSLLNASFDKATKIGIVVPVFIIAYVFIGQFLSSEIFHASSYQAQLTVDKEADFYADNETVNYQSIPVVDKDSAQRLGDRKMGEIVEYVSQFEVDDEYSQINYNNKPYRVTTLSYSDLIKWFTNHKAGLPAYISVDMVTQESKVVKLDEGMKYSHSDLFFRNIDRYLRVKYPTLMFDNVSFEIDDQGIPYWVAPSYEYEIGLFGGKDINGAVLVNAVNGECQYYNIDEIPNWIDRVYPSELVLEQLTNWGQYTNGYLNTLFSQKGVLQATDGYNYIALNDDVYLYTGLTSISSDASNVGFALINLRTKDAKYYAISGAEEYSAMSSAEGKVQNLGYSATFPILINAGGHPTYFMSLKDDAGLVKQYAFVSVENYQIVATGESVAAAEKAYYNLLKDNGQTATGTVGDSAVEGKVVSLSSAVVSGNTYYYFMIEGDENIYIASIQSNNYLPLMQIGDTVSFEYDSHSSSVENIVSIEMR
ncbi:MAG: CvpA family protein [Bacilli bacterium]|nr:CvpA family protein [Bacilli bacterium]